MMTDASSSWEINLFDDDLDKVEMQERKFTPRMPQMPTSLLEHIFSWLQPAFFAENVRPACSQWQHCVTPQTVLQCSLRNFWLYAKVVEPRRLITLTLAHDKKRGRGQTTAVETLVANVDALALCVNLKVVTLVKVARLEFFHAVSKLPKLQSLRLHDLEITTRSLEQFVGHECLRELELRNADRLDVWSQYVLGSLSKLTRLVVHKTSFDEQTSFCMDRSWPSLANLTTLELHIILTAECLGKLKSCNVLQTLRFQCEHGFLPEDLPLLPNVQVLAITVDEDDCDVPTRTSDVSLAARTPRLQSLALKLETLAPCWRLNELWALEVLSLAVSSFTEEALADILQGCFSLRRLELIELDNVTGVDSFAHLPLSLRDITLNNCGIVNEGLARLGHVAGSSLSQLALLSCYQLTAKGFRFLSRFRVLTVLHLTTEHCVKASLLNQLSDHLEQLKLDVGKVLLDQKIHMAKLHALSLRIGSGGRARLRRVSGDHPEQASIQKLVSQLGTLQTLTVNPGSDDLIDLLNLEPGTTRTKTVSDYFRQSALRLKHAQQTFALDQKLWKRFANVRLHKWEE